MRVVIFCHSLISDWNHGNAHFLRGVVTELMFRGHRVDVYEPRDGWSLLNLLAEQGYTVLSGFRRAYPHLSSHFYDRQALDLEAVLSGADLVIVHEWNDAELVNRIGEHRRREGGYRLFFHDTHHRLITDRAAMDAYDLRHYDGVLAFGNMLRDLYRARPGFPPVWTWHEAADVRVFRPRPGAPLEGDVVWIGNWGGAELREFFIQPVKALGLRARVYGARYPKEALDELARSGIEFGGWIPNYRVPDIFGRFRVTVHIPRRPYVAALPGIPTIRPFEAMASGIPLVCGPWPDTEGLFEPGRDFLIAKDGSAMTQALATLIGSPERAQALAAHGRRTILSRHTCAHRVDALLELEREVRRSRETPRPVARVEPRLLSQASIPAGARVA